MVAKKAPEKSNVSKDDLLKYYREMLLIRRFEERAGQMYGMGLIGGFCHLYIGQEAVITGVHSAMKDGDSLITAYRDHGHAIAVGMELNPLMAELYGKATGCAGGRAIRRGVAFARRRATPRRRCRRRCGRRSAR